MKLTGTRRILSLALGVAATVLTAAGANAQSTVSTASPRRVLQAVDTSDGVSLASSVRPWVKHASDLGAVPASTAAPKMLLLLSRSAEQQQALEELLSDLQNPASPRYHHWLTPSQFGAAFGANADDVQSVTSWLQSQGFTVTKVAKARNLIEFSGNVGQVEQAFHTDVHRLSLNGVSTMTSVTALQVPRALSPVIQGVVNLDSAKPRTSVVSAGRATYDPSSHRIKPDLTLYDSYGDPGLYMDPADAAIVYDTPNAALNPYYSGTPLDGSGVTVGVVGDSNVDLTPVSNYRQAFLNETAATVNLPTVIVDGNDPGLNGDVTESFLDLEVLGGIAPKAQIFYYTSDNSDLSAGLQNAIARAVEDNAVSILSISYSSCEADQGPTGNAFFAAVYQQASAQGMTITVSSGDSGPANCDVPGEPAALNGMVVNALGSTPYNISVGGTDFDALSGNFSQYVNAATSGNPPYYATALQYIPERPWNDSTLMSTSIAANTPLSNHGATNIIAGGGGMSSLYAKPAFQTALTPADSARDLPDVSFLAGNGLYGAAWVLCGYQESGGDDCETTAGQFTSSTTFSGVGGTSAAAPAFAGMLALVEQSTGSRLGQANNILYQLAATHYSTVFHDVVTGDNAVVCASGSAGCGSNGFTTGYNAITGYDLASGLGSVDAAAMVKNWSSAVSASTGTTLTINGGATPVSVTHGTTLGINVAVTPATASGSAALIANTSLVSGQLAIPLTNGVGSISYNGLPGGTYTVYARYGGDSTDAASSSNTININIAPEASTTSLTINPYTALSSSPIQGLNAIPYGSYVFSDAFVYGTAEGQAASQGQPTGTVTYFDNGSPLATTTITSLDFASFPGLSASASPGSPRGVYPFSAGKHTITASYAGDASYNASTSAPVTFTVLQGSTQISVVPTNTSTTSVTNDIITVNIVTNGLGNIPTGTVTLISGNTTLGTTSNIQNSKLSGLVSGAAIFDIAGDQLQPGANTLVATYTGDNNYVGGTASVVVTMSKATFSLSSTSINVTAGSTTNDSAMFRATPLNDFTGVVDLTCAVTSVPTGATSPVTCSVPATLNLSGLSAVAGALVANTTAETTGGTYTVTITGVDAATKTITVSANSTVTVTGETVTPAFAVTSAGAITIAPGASTGNTSLITVTPSGAFSGPVALACAVTSSPAGASDPLTCSLSNPTVTLTGSTAATSMLTVSSTAMSTAALGRRFGASGVVVAFLLLMMPTRRRRLAPLVCLLLLAGAGAMTGCSSGQGSSTPTNPGTTAGSYVVTISGTAPNAAPSTTTVTVTVN